LPVAGASGIRIFPDRSVASASPRPSPLRRSAWSACRTWGIGLAEDSLEIENPWMAKESVPVLQTFTDSD